MEKLIYIIFLFLFASCSVNKYSSEDIHTIKSNYYDNGKLRYENNNRDTSIQWRGKYWEYY